MIHSFQQLNKTILVDTVTQAIVSIDPILHALLDFPEETPWDDRVHSLSHKYDEKDLRSAVAEWEAVVAGGLIHTGEEPDEERAPRLEPAIKALCLHVSHDCDLRCKYCFASQGDFKGARELMSVETGKKALDFLVAHSGNRRNLEVDFFGGEPLLNFETVKELTEYGRTLNEKHGKNIRFTITTNGVALDDDKIDYINENMTNVVLSLDGRKEVHDRMRPTVNGKGSYDVVLPKFKKLIEQRGEKDHYIRGTFTAENLDFDRDVLHYFDEGFHTVSMEPVVTDPNEPYALGEEHLARVLESYERLAEEMLSRADAGERLRFFHFMVDLTDGPCLAKKQLGCGAGVEYLAVTPRGDLYPCHQFVGEEDFLLGNLDDGIQNTALVERFLRTTTETKEDCRVCWNRTFCSGGCHANAYFQNGSIDRPYELACEMQKKRTECALALRAHADEN